MDAGEEDSSRVLLGHITGVSGLKGWVKVHSDTQPRINIVNYSTWLLDQSDRWTEWKVLGGRAQGKTIVAQLEGVSTPEQAALLTGRRIAVTRDSLPALENGEFYWADLTGMRVRTVDSVEIGAVTRLFETGANDVMVVSDTRADPSSRKEVLVPWLVPDVITEVDSENRVITIDWDPDF